MKSIDPGSEWATEATQSLREHGYAKIRLSAMEAKLTSDMYAAAEAAFENPAEMHALRVPDRMLDDLDTRDGHVQDRTREWLELHSFPPKAFGSIEEPKAAKFLEYSLEFASMCEARCTQALHALATADTACPNLGSLLQGETRARAEDRQEMIQPMLRVYRYHGLLREREGDPHYDIGLLTMIPKSSSPGLEIRPENSSDWIQIEHFLKDDEAILFGGMTLARLTGIPALFHRILTRGRIRISAPYFQRAAPHVFLAASPGHTAETVRRYNARLRDLRNSELRADGSVPAKRSPSPIWSDRGYQTRGPPRRRDDRADEWRAQRRSYHPDRFSERHSGDRDSLRDARGAHRYRPHKAYSHNDRCDFSRRSSRETCHSESREPSRGYPYCEPHFNSSDDERSRQRGHASSHSFRADDRRHAFRGDRVDPRREYHDDREWQASKSSLPRYRSRDGSYEHSSDRWDRRDHSPAGATSTTSTFDNPDRY